MLPNMILVSSEICLTDLTTFSALPNTIFSPNPRTCSIGTTILCTLYALGIWPFTAFLVLSKAGIFLYVPESYLRENWMEQFLGRSHSTDFAAFFNPLEAVYHS